MIYKRGKHGIYSYRFRFAGRMIHESARTKSKTLAREAERQRQRELEERINNVKKRGLPPTFERAAHEWQEGRTHVQAKTISVAEEALKHLLPTFGGRLLCDIAPDDIATYQGRRQRENAQGRTVNIEIGTLRQILKGYDLWQPLANKVRMLRERRDVARALTPEQECALLRATAERDSACHTAVLLALNTGMRQSEILMLHWRQIDFAKRTLTVGQSMTEASTGRLIPLNAAALDALLRWAKGFPSTEADHFVFPACENRLVDPSRPAKGWRTAWRQALKRAGFHCRFHDLRVTCITKMAESQTPELVIMSVAGHVSRAMLEHYSRIRTDAKRRALDGIAQPVFETGVHQNVHQVADDDAGDGANLLN